MLRYPAILFVLLLASASPANAGDKLVSPDMQIEVTVNDNVLSGLDKRSNTRWTFPPASEAKGIFHHAAFAYAKSDVNQRFGPTLYIAYGSFLYSVNGKGKMLWKYRLDLPEKSAVSFTLKNNEIHLKAGNTVKRFNMLDGRLLK